MKRITFIIALTFTVLNLFSQGCTKDLIVGNWYNVDDKILNLAVNESLSFTKDIEGDLFLKWTFEKDAKYTRSLTMLTPDHQDEIKYKSKPAKWFIEDDKNEVVIKDDDLAQVFKIISLNEETLSVQRIK